MIHEISPLVTIGIPAYNRAILLKRAIESALNQDYPNIEVIVSDNASIDDTENVCRQFCVMDSRFKYIRHETNRGAKANFTEVLERAEGVFFMWLGDDDWIDRNYIRLCIEQMINDPTIVLVSGSPYYYNSGELMYKGKVFSLLDERWWFRVVEYYSRVSDNGMFYGLMPSELIKKIDILHAMGADWMMLANVLVVGKAKMLTDTSVHRELGGMSASYQNIAAINGLPRVQAILPHLFIAGRAFVDIISKKNMFKSQSFFACVSVAVSVFSMIILRRLVSNVVNLCKSLKVNTN